MSATVLRELVARLGFEVDKKGFDQAERGVSGIKTALRGADSRLRDARGRFLGAGAGAAQLGKKGKEAKEALEATKKAAGGANDMLSALAKFAATVGITHLLKSMIEMASDANETSSALKELFGAEGLAQVQKWSGEMALTMGRSKYDLQAYAARLGAVIEPMIGSREKAQEMSQTLSELAVDLGSFFNATDEDAMAALRSGLTGEYESLKRFGVVMNDATLQAYAHTAGMKKKVSTMSIAEKTQLRYNFILKQSKTAQGDAARTSEGYANATKALKSYFKDLGTEMGMAVIPRIERLVRYARDGIARFKELAKNTWVLESAMYTLSAVAAALAINLAWPFLLPAAAILGLILLVDELHGLFTGGKSAIGDWLDEVGGFGTADKTVRSLTDAFRNLMDTVDMLPDMQGSLDLFIGSIDDVIFAIDRLIDKMLWTLSGPARAWNGMMEKLNHIFRLPETEAGKRIRLENEARMPKARTDPNLDQHVFEDGSQPTVIRNQVNKRRQEREAQIRAEVEARRAAREERRKQRDVDKAISQETDVMSRDSREDDYAGMSSDPNAGGDLVQFGQARASSADWSVRAPAPEPWAPPMSGAGANMMVNVGGNVVTINGGNINEVNRVVKEVMAAERRKTLAAIASQPGGR